MTNALNIRQMTHAEVNELVHWAQLEGWNPGLHDAELFWTNDPDAFIAAELNGELIGGGAITSYSGEYGFMGFFIVRPEFRGLGLGDQIWRARRERLLARLRPGATIGLDGVFTMQDYYARGGFAFSHRNVRFRGEFGAKLGQRSGQRLDHDRGVASDGTSDCAQVVNANTAAASHVQDDSHSSTLMPLTEIPFDSLLAYDRTCFPAPRPGFLKGWITQQDGLALGLLRDGALSGFGVTRRCVEGYKIGPLFTDDAEAAQTLFTPLAAFAGDHPIFIDAPENNPAALALVQRHGMVEVFGCARMYLGAVPDIAHQQIFGVTSFELG
ncbi:GNAT family N-acetyltransferase [Lamprobacter modestohalophilus]|uniref:GNAT family N-acetyltransferase n=1 Tax=Lamprobacter modestohalophilus TaxID=1064514 RepID=UPI002ADEF677|nr:GNAT family N-acetyltransferase [Lamprobacter modestohalophilus]MEA1050430.1 GNAT family N-acetyltransferase [Lamprobacter modestohalophilus]